MSPGLSINESASRQSKEDILERAASDQHAFGNEPAMVNGSGGRVAILGVNQNTVGQHFHSLTDRGSQLSQLFRHDLVFGRIKAQFEYLPGRIAVDELAR